MEAATGIDLRISLRPPRSTFGFFVLLRAIRQTTSSATEDTQNSKFGMSKGLKTDTGSRDSSVSAPGYSRQL